MTVQGLPRPVLAAAVGLPLLLAAAAVVIALTLARGGPGPAAGASTPLALAAVPAPDAGSPGCSALLAALPQRLTAGATRLDRRPLADPAPPGAAAWGADRPAVLRCGLDRPVELVPTSELLEIDGVRWLELAGDQGAATWVAVDRDVYVALTLTGEAATGPLQEVSSAIMSALPARPVRPTS